MAWNIKNQLPDTSSQTNQISAAAATEYYTNLCLWDSLISLLFSINMNITTSIVCQKISSSIHYYDGHQKWCFPAIQTMIAVQFFVFRNFSRRGIHTPVQLRVRCAHFDRILFWWSIEHETTLIVQLHRIRVNFAIIYHSLPIKWWQFLYVCVSWVCAPHSFLICFWSPWLDKLECITKKKLFFQMNGRSRVEI